MMDIKRTIGNTKPIWLLFIPSIKTIVLIYVLMMLLVLRTRVNEFYYSLLVNQLNDLYELLTNDRSANILTTLLVVVVGSYIVFRIYSRKSFSWLLICSLFSIIYLWNDDYWVWAKTIVLIDYKWLFIILFFAIVIVSSILLVKKIKNTPRKDRIQNEENGFSVTTTKEAMQDTGWQSYAENLTEKLLATNTSEESFAVGVSGIWGSGKTTFLSAIKKDLKGRAYIVEFNPWNSDSATQISDDFFKTLISNLTISSYQRRSITQYAKLLGQLNAFGNHTQLVTSIIEDSLTPISDAKDKTEDVIGSMPLPVVVLIDDLDRLDGAELMAVLRLVRVTANFRNLIFVVAYDKDYVSQTLANVGVKKGDEFLKKIFPLEICLPAFESFVTANHLYSELKTILKNDAILKELEFRIYHGTSRHAISYYLPTFRDVKRFVNQFTLDINSFIRTGQVGEIDVTDFFMLELLHYYDFAAYQQIQNEPLSILDYGFSVHKKYAYSYREIGSIKGVKSIEEKDERRKQILDCFKDGVPDLLWVLFGSTTIRGDNLLRFPTNFSKYFSYRINKDVISQGEFRKLLELNSKEEVSEKVREYCKGDVSKRASLKYHLTSYELDNNNKKKVFNAAFALLELAMYGGIDAGPTFKVLFDKSRYKETDGIAEALISALKEKIGYEGSWRIIQNILTALVEFDIIDSCDENGGYVDYASVLDWQQLQELAEENFMSALGGRTIDIQKITDEKSRYHDFLASAVAQVSIEYYDGEHDEKNSRSLLANKLGEIYSKVDNKLGLKPFFENLIPDTGDYVLDTDEFVHYRNRNIASVFGETSKREGFYAFIEKVFKDSLPEVNKQLKNLEMEEIKLEANAVNEGEIEHMGDQ